MCHSDKWKMSEVRLLYTHAQRAHTQKKEILEFRDSPLRITHRNTLSPSVSAAGKEQTEGK